jgi:hypothetical protein
MLSKDSHHAHAPDTRFVSQMILASKLRTPLLNPGIDAISTPDRNDEGKEANDDKPRKDEETANPPPERRIGW